MIIEDAQKNERFNEWDNKYSNLPKPTNANLQRLLYSACYGGNVVKWGVIL